VRSAAPEIDVGQVEHRVMEIDVSQPLQVWR
jgi:hypothetical protein